MNEMENDFYRNAYALSKVTNRIHVSNKNPLPKLESLLLLHKNNVALVIYVEYRFV